MVVFNPAVTRKMGVDDEGNDIIYVEGTCLKDDVKPTGNFFQSSWLMELDSKKVKFYDAENETWR